MSDWFPPEQAETSEDGYRMPRSVRAAQVIVLGFAAVGIVCTASSGWLLGTHAALMTALPFAPGFLLGLVALTFNSEGQAVRISSILLAALNMLWTVPSITDGRPPGPLGIIASLAVIMLLLRRDARDWFEPSW